MSTLAKRIFLTFAVFASCACALWIALTVYVVFIYHGVEPSARILLPSVVPAVAAAIGFKFYYDERSGAPTFGTEQDAEKGQYDDGRLLTTPLGRGLAVGFTAFVFVLAIQDALHPDVRHVSSPPFSYMLHGRALVAANVVFWGGIGWLAMSFIRGTRDRERVAMIGWTVSLLLSPLEHVLPPYWIMPMRYIDVLALLIALLAAVSLWVRPMPTADR